MKALGWKLTVLLIASAAIAVGLLVYGDPFAANIAFFVVGGLVAIVTQLAMELQKRHELQRDLAASLYQELANRVARCLFDFEEPWERWIDVAKVGGTEVEVLRLRKFMAVAPTIYPATAGQIALLTTKAAQAVIAFYARFDIYRGDMEAVAHNCEMRELLHVRPREIAILAERLRRTLKPGLRALRALSNLVPDSDEIDAEAIGELDVHFKHERAHLTLRQRLEHYAEQ